MNKLLYKSSDVRREIIRLFSSGGRRVAITAFVGAGAETYLQKPGGIHLICWPKAGGTNPNALRMLMKKGVRISFADSLHMKVYWSERKGTVIASANLSTNALGVGGLKEVGVLLPKGKVDIDRIIRSIKIRPITEKELKQLDRLHKVYVINNRGSFKAAPQGLSYKEWYSLPSRPDWKLGWWDEEIEEMSLSAKKVSKKEYDVDEPEWGIACRKGEYRQGDWALSFRLTENGASIITWMFIDYVVKLTGAEKRLYHTHNPCDAVQVWPLNRYPERPFRIDGQFRKAFSKAVKEYGTAKIKTMRTSRPPVQLLSMVYKHYS